MGRPRLITPQTRLLAALLHSEGRSNKDIGKKFGLGESTISKIIRECYDEGLLSIRFRSGLSDGELERLRAEAGLKNEFTEKLRAFRKDSSAIVLAPEAMVFESGSTDTGPQDWAARLDTFARAVGPEVLKLILRSRIVGTSWGRTLATVVRALGEAQVPLPHSPVHFLPLCGEMLDGPPRKTSASSLALRLDELVNHAAPNLHGHMLAAVPSHLPLHLPPRDAEIIAGYVTSVPAYRAIFGGQRNPKQAPLVDRTDMILTSCGPQDRPLGYDAARWFESTGIAEEDARAYIAGDISGNLLRNMEAGKLPRAVERKIERVNEAWLGAKFDHLRACAQRALEGQLPGVVLCCIGANKAGTVREVVRLGLANRLLIDEDCWSALEKML
ncbi:MAG: hypothetical protein JNK48_21005 [Bryobacterales bacterium]|nr:hypothetical protein [Bryobacterales bacterium]